jgi:flagellar biosynthesis/type III secretory pathway protein FliH
MIARGRVVSSGDLSEEPTRVLSGLRAGGARVVPKAVADAMATARAIVRRAEEDALDLRARVRDEERQKALAELAAGFAVLRREQAERDERDLDRSIELARMMAERVLGEALALDPSRVCAIAKTALSSVRAARRIAIRAHPDDAAALSADVAHLGLDAAALTIQVDPERPRGALLLATDLGTIDADTSLQLDRLTAALRDGLRR